MFVNSIFALNVFTLADPDVFDACYQSQRPERRERVDRMRFENGKRLCLGLMIAVCSTYENFADSITWISPP